MKDSIREAKEFVEEHSDANITFVGHSKGGAEAVANAVATNKNAKIFNPATVNLLAYGLSSINYSAEMTAFIVDGEVLNNIFGWASTPIDDIKRLNTDISGGFKKHSIDAVIDALSE